MESTPGVTRLLKAWREGDPAALQQLVPLIYDELHRIARRYMRHEKQENTLQTTALVNQAWVSLMGGAPMEWQDRAHFFAVSSQIMRHILVDAARSRKTERRGGEVHHFPWNDSIDAARPRDAELIALDDALESLQKLDARKARVVELRFFGGLSVDETAAVLKISPQSVMRDWKLARVWLSRQIRSSH